MVIYAPRTTRNHRRVSTTMHSVQRILYRPPLHRRTPSPGRSLLRNKPRTLFLHSRARPAGGGFPQTPRTGTCTLRLLIRQRPTCLPSHYSRRYVLQALRGTCCRLCPAARTWWCQDTMLHVPSPDSTLFSLLWASVAFHPWPPDPRLLRHCHSHLLSFSSAPLRGLPAFLPSKAPIYLLTPTGAF